MINFKSFIQAARIAVKKVIEKKDNFSQEEPVIKEENGEEKYSGANEKGQISLITFQESPEKIPEPDIVLIPAEVAENEEVQNNAESGIINKSATEYEIDQEIFEIVEEIEKTETKNEVYTEPDIKNIVNEITVENDVLGTETITSNLIVHVLNTSHVVMAQLDNALLNCKAMNSVLIKEPGNSVKFKFETNYEKPAKGKSLENSSGAKTYIESIIYNHYSDNKI